MGTYRVRSFMACQLFFDEWPYHLHRSVNILRCGRCIPPYEAVLGSLSALHVYQEHERLTGGERKGTY
jgi:hypothetical protein